MEVELTHFWSVSEYFYRVPEKRAHAHRWRLSSKII
jgi:hypothetical protein